MTLNDIQKLITGRGYQYSRRSIQRWIKRRAIPAFGPSQKLRYYAAAEAAEALELDFPALAVTRARKASGLLTLKQLQKRGCK